MVERDFPKRKKTQAHTKEASTHAGEVAQATVGCGIGNRLWGCIGCGWYGGLIGKGGDPHGDFSLF